MNSRWGVTAISGDPSRFWMHWQVQAVKLLEFIILMISGWRAIAGLVIARIQRPNSPSTFKPTGLCNSP